MKTVLSAIKEIKQGAMRGQGFGEDYQKCLDVTFWLRPKTCVKRSSLDCLKTK